MDTKIPHTHVGCLKKSQGDAVFFHFLNYCSQLYDKPNLGKAIALLQFAEVKYIPAYKVAVNVQGYSIF